MNNNFVSKKSFHSSEISFLCNWIAKLSPLYTQQTQFFSWVVKKKQKHKTILRSDKALLFSRISILFTIPISCHHQRFHYNVVVYTEESICWFSLNVAVLRCYLNQRYSKSLLQKHFIAMHITTKKCSAWHSN